MKVRELIEKLQEQDPEKIVFVYDMSYWDCEVEDVSLGRYTNMHVSGQEGQQSGVGVKLS